MKKGKLNAKHYIFKAARHFSATLTYNLLEGLLNGLVCAPVHL